MKNEGVFCCMCKKAVNHSMTPSICYGRYMDKSHRICSDCWFNPDIGFAGENRSHKCPGCASHFPLTKVSYNGAEVIDLLEQNTTYPLFEKV
jgi:hypothetical protein